MEWLFGGPAGWQEAVAAVIVAAAVVSLYRHLRGMFGAASPSGSGAGCRGCAGDCEEPDPATDAAALAARGETPRDTGSGVTPVTPTARGSLH